MYDEQIKGISLFFFFALLDENKAMTAATRAVDLFFSRMRKNPQSKPNVMLVYVTLFVWQKMKGNFLRGRPHYSTESGWHLPANLDDSPWKQFQKEASEDELLSVIWSQILKISEDEISYALGVSDGTIRYRIGRSLRKLGSMISSKPRLEVSQ
jgi:hypothetical protein